MVIAVTAPVKTSRFAFGADIIVALFSLYLSELTTPLVP